LAAKLREVGVLASPVADANRLLQTNLQLQFRGYFETTAHPVVGRMPLSSLPFRYASVDRWLRTPSPTLGEHNERVLGGLLGLSKAELAALEADGVIGTRPDGL
jgi:crotonobetainyl-CoA:carnitine CoA-transferase CaiB-like acyl-CoA transferase